MNQTTRPIDYRGALEVSSPLVCRAYLVCRRTVVMKQIQEWKDLLAELSPPVADASTTANFLFTEQVRGDHFVDSKVNLAQLTIPGLVFGRAKLRTLLETKISSSQSASSSIEDVTISADSLREVHP
jgi:hypothetical protein